MTITNGAGGAGSAQPQEALLPNARDAEEAVLGSILINPDVMPEVAEILVGGALDFQDPNRRAIYRAMLGLWHDGESIDLITVTDKLAEAGALDDITESYVSTLTTRTPTSANAAAYARRVRRVARRIGLYKMARDLGSDAILAESEEALNLTVSGVLDALTLDTAGQSADSLTLMRASEAEALPPLRGILGSILFDESVAYLYGPSGRWKSFLALDWALSIATGRSWLGRPVVEGDVVYICSEGARGIGKRITAWRTRHGIANADRLRVLAASIDLTQPSQVARLARRLLTADIQPTLIVVDTLAAANSGDENTAQNAGLVTMAARRIIQSHPGACVLIVHHTGYDDSHMRGSTALYANADTVIKIAGGENNRRLEPGDPIKVISDKAKDGEPFTDIALTAEQQTWADDTGVIHSSLVMTPADEALLNAKTQNAALTEKRRFMLTILEEAGEDGVTRQEAKQRSGYSSSTAYSTMSWLVDNGYARQEMIGLDCRYYCLVVPTIPTHSNAFQSPKIGTLARSNSNALL